MTLELVENSSEDPFENFVNDVPKTAMCRTILRDMLEDTDIPKGIKSNNGVLM